MEDATTGKCVWYDEDGNEHCSDDMTQFDCGQQTNSQWYPGERCPVLAESLQQQ